MLTSLFRSKPRVKFDVVVRLDHLSNIPLVNGYLYIKWRLKNGGSGSGVSERVQIDRHQAHWNQDFPLEITCTIDPETSVLESVLLLLSVRLETNGGKSYDSLGSVQLDLAEYAGSHKPQTRKYLLRESLLNSTLQLTITMQKTAGDRLFKTPNKHASDPSKNPRNFDSGQVLIDSVLSSTFVADETLGVQSARTQLADFDVHPMGVHYRRLRSLAPDMNANAAIANAHEVVANIFRIHVPPEGSLRARRASTPEGMPRNDALLIASSL